MWRETLSTQDSAAIQRLVQSTGFFSAAEVAFAVELVEEHLVKGPASGYHFLLAETRGTLAGYTCFGPVPGTEASFDLYWIAVHAEFRQRGIGRRLLQRTEDAIRRMGGLRLYAETSSRDQYLPTRNFYRVAGFEQAAFLPDFYRQGDGKRIYLKRLFPRSE
jgi:ribosomal protein S18 acetylase RimI-like enzyme